MCVKYLGFALLVWIPALLHAQEPCRAPILEDGYFATVPPGAQIIYSCDKGYKPAVEGWWANSICKNGKWDHEPKCIDEKACIVPAIPNAKPPEGSKGWYNEGTSMKVICKEGYEVNGLHTATCMDGRWTSLPVCEKQSGACTKPQYIPNAVIMHRDDQEVFPDRSNVRYKCKERYATARRTSEQYMTCRNGNWEGRLECTIRSGPPDQDTSPAIATTDRCGEFPLVENGDFIQEGQRSLKFQCAAHYKLVGPKEVVCYSNGKWSETPKCRPNYCSVDTEQYPDLKNDGNRFISNGETEILDCVDKWRYRNYALVECNNGIPRISECCNWTQIRLGLC